MAPTVGKGNGRSASADLQWTCSETPGAECSAPPQMAARMHDWQHSAEGINAGAQTVILPKSAGHSAAFFSHDKSASAETISQTEPRGNGGVTSPCHHQ
jgi:hypothetical protein